jgi:hypothetical protein
MKSSSRFITVRIELDTEQLSYSQALEFISQFRHLENVLKRADYPIVCYQDKEYKEVESFLFTEVVPTIKPYLDNTGLGEAYFETLPFFVDERMYVQAFFVFAEGEELDIIDGYRAGQLNGLNEDGSPHVSANNMRYIEKYAQENMYARWVPRTYFVVDDDAFVCLTTERKKQARKLANQMYGEYYYTLLLNFFHKIVLLKLSTEHSIVQMEKDHEDVEELIRSITDFSSRHFFVETISQTQGKEIFHLIRKTFRINELYDDVRQTLNSLYQYQDKFSDKRNSYLLMVLTIYTVISGIYGMNQVIEELKGNIDWSMLKNFSLFEWIAFLTTISGLTLAVVMGGSAVYNWARGHLRERKRKREYNGGWKKPNQ